MVYTLHLSVISFLPNVAKFKYLISLDFPFIIRANSVVIKVHWLPESNSTLHLTFGTCPGACA